jgi:hypothetical protein
VIKTETIKLYDLVKETERVMRFIDIPINVKSMPINITIRCIPVKYIISETSHVKNEKDFEIEKSFEKLNIFDNNLYFRNSVDVNGKMVVFSRHNGFMEINISGSRIVPTIFQEDYSMTFKDPIRRDVVYINKTYPDIFNETTKALKVQIQWAILRREKTRQILSRLMKYIHEIDNELLIPYLPCDGKLHVENNIEK